ncbi:hypothetical protein [Streptomyces candidus]|uniref:Uncharacterized protein n=1 Tax=Streptomyces candidus TaxID=67283 RepID=A0A7X0HLY7_9ACTN|nr:hypothetical protein [Streptomyces candidus]MBB6439991.1 hypothetical protein [Streptomyces candidus]GHH57445.1 hypothetical protein GCM10018773_64800 [Streptomyces candidus]
MFAASASGFVAASPAHAAQPLVDCQAGIYDSFNRTINATECNVGGVQNYLVTATVTVNLSPFDIGFECDGGVLTAGTFAGVDCDRK